MYIFKLLYVIAIAPKPALRIGDMLSEGSIQHGYRVVTRDYLLRGAALLIDRLLEARPHCALELVFLVVSDDQQWARANFDAPLLREHLAFGPAAAARAKASLVGVEHVSGRLLNAGAELTLLASCEQLLLSLGSFGWWAAALNARADARTFELPSERAAGGAAEFQRAQFDLPEGGLEAEAAGAGAERDEEHSGTRVAECDAKPPFQVVYCDEAYEVGSDVHRALETKHYWPPSWTAFH